MNTLLWILQGILGALFITAGIMKSTQAKDKLSKSLPWVNDYSSDMVKFIGISELLGGIGMVVPELTGILPVLTPLAAIGIAIIMVLASLYHIRKKEMKSVGFNAILFFIAITIAFGRS